MEQRLSELELFLSRCEYPKKIINKGIFNARLQGPAPKKTEKKDIISFTHQNMSNFEFKHILTITSNLIKNAKSEQIREIFKGTRFVEAIKQPKNLLRTITSRKTTHNQEEIRPGIFAECSDPRCEICSFGYIQDCSSFTTSNGTTWEIRSHINCNSRNVIYYLECLMCDGKVTKTGKASTRLRERINNHRSECATGRTTDVFDRHCHDCGAHRKEEPYFRLRAFMKLGNPEKLLTIERRLHERKYATINT